MTKTAREVAYDFVDSFNWSDKPTSKDAGDCLIAYFLERGFVIVPKEPSVSMIKAAAHAEHDHFYPKTGMTEHTWRSLPAMLIAKIYRAMIAAAREEPKP